MLGNFVSRSQYEMFQCDNVRQYDAQQIVRIARHQITLHHFRALADRLLEARERIFHLLFQTYLNEYIDAQAERFGMEQRDVLLEQPCFFERTRLKHGVAERLTARASSEFVMRAFC